MTVPTRRNLPREALVVAVLAAGFGALQATTLYLGLRGESSIRFTPSLPRLLTWQVASWLVWGALAPAVLALGSRVGPERPLRWLAVHVPAALAAATLHATAGVWLTSALHPFGSGDDQPLAQRILGRVTNTLHLELLVYALIVGGAHAVDLYRRARDRELRSAQLEGSLAEARLEALQLQLQPHFLFNALHTVAGLVRQGENAGAVTMLARLSDLLRATLEGGRRPLVPLRKELQLADLYLAIQEVRFADRLTVEREVDASLLESAVPPFLLQPLLENAVRHGLGTRAGAGWLKIVARRDGDRLDLEVHDDGRGLGPGGDTVEGVGLSNTRARLAQLFGDAARLELSPRPGGGAVARLTVPLVAAVRDEPTPRSPGGVGGGAPPPNAAVPSPERA